MSRGLRIVVAGDQDVDRLGQERRKVVVAGVNVEPTAATPRSPELAGGIRFIRALGDRAPDRERQLQTQSMEGRAAIFTLGAPFGCLGTDPGGPVGQNDRGLDLVAILAARTCSPRGSKLALGRENGGIDGSGVVGRGCCALVLTGAVRTRLIRHRQCSRRHFDFGPKGIRRCPSRLMRRCVNFSHYYNTSLGRSHKVPVHSTIILLRPAADGPDINGLFERRDRNGDVYDWFRYHVVRIWEQPLAEVLAAGLPVLPLAPVADVEPAKVPDVLMAISERLVRETSPEQAATLWAATKVLMGLRYPKEQVEGFMRGASAMILGIRGIEESSVYQDIFAKGEAEGEAKGRVEGRVEGRLEGAVDEARETLLRQGRKKLGPPSEAVEARITALGDLERLNHLLDRILEVSTWDELLAPLFPSS